MKTLFAVKGIALAPQAGAPQSQNPFSNVIAEEKGIMKTALEKAGRLLRAAIEALKAEDNPKAKLMLASLVFVAATACQGTSQSKFNEQDGGPDTDTSSDTDVDSDTDTDSDSDTDTDTDTDTESDGGTDTDTDTDTEVPVDPDTVSMYIEGEPGAPASYSVHYASGTCLLQSHGTIAVNSEEGYFVFSGVSAFDDSATMHAGQTIYLIPDGDFMAEGSLCGLFEDLDLSGALALLDAFDGNIYAYEMGLMDEGLLEIAHVHNETTRGAWIYDPTNFTTMSGYLEFWFSNPAGEYEDNEVSETLAFAALRDGEGYVSLVAPANTATAGTFYKLMYTADLDASHPVGVASIPAIDSYISETTIPAPGPYTTLGDAVYSQSGGEITLALPNL
jgi:hypothetical protein